MKKNDYDDRLLEMAYFFTVTGGPTLLGNK